MKNKGLICQILFSVKNKKTNIESIRNVYNENAMKALDINLEMLKEYLAPEIDTKDGIYFAEIGLQLEFPMWAEFIN